MDSSFCFRLFDMTSTKPWGSDIGVEGSDVTGSRKWSADQEEMFLDLFVCPELKPIGGDGDGETEGKEAARWAPLLARFLAANETLVARAAENGGKRIKNKFDVPTLRRKWHAFRE
jgi:hypothetical protein